MIGSRSSEQFKTRSNEGDDGLEAETRARVEHENAKRDAADGTFAPRRGKRPVEDLMPGSSKRAKRHVDTANGIAVDTRPTLRANPGRRYDSLTEANQVQRSDLVDKISEIWTPEYSKWPLKSAKAQHRNPPHTPLDWEQQLLSNTLTLAQKSKSHGISTEDVYTRLAQALEERRSANENSPKYIFAADVQTVIDGMPEDSQAQDESRYRARSLTQIWPEHRCRDSSDAQTARNPVFDNPMHEETAASGNNADTRPENQHIESPSQHNQQENEAAGSVKSIKGVMAPFIHSMDAQAIYQLAEDVLGLADARKSLEEKMASFVAG